MQPHGFSWIEKPLLAALARPQDVDDLHWLRREGIDVLLSLTEDPPRSDWIDEAGLMLVHVPVPDMEAPTPEQIDHCMSAIHKANAKSLGVAVHCGAGLGRTGVIAACWLVSRSTTARNAIARVRRLRPESIETDDQERCITSYEKRLGAKR